MNDRRDPLLDRAVDELRKLPDVDPAAIERVAARAAASRLSAADDDLLNPPRHRRAWLWASGAVAVVVIAGLVLRTDALRDDTAATSPRAAAGPVRSVADNASDRALPIAHQFVLNDRAAHRVAVVGDFNGWNPTSAPMTRAPGGDLWSATILVPPGRHTFGYMVDDSSFVLDPHMPKSRDPDLGTEGSVVIVGRP